MTSRTPITLIALAIAATSLQPALHDGYAQPIATCATPARSKPETCVLDEASAVVDFWREAGPGLWFAKDDDFDRRFRDRFIATYQAAARGELGRWASTADGALALMILLDQFPRNAFRGTPRMYATDDLARQLAQRAIEAGHDLAIDKQLALFFYLPFAHSEALADQELSVELAERLGEPSLTRAKHHRDIIRQFGRFPHRNPILGRPLTEDEQRYLNNGGFRG